MLTAAESNRIVKACIKRISGRDSLVEQKLKEVGITTQNRIDLLIGRIVSDTEIGVPSKQHQIDANFFRFVGTATKVGEVSKAVRENAEETAQ